MPHLPAASQIIAMAREQGFALAGVAPAEPSPRADYVDQWLAAGKHGEMDYLRRHRDIMLDPRKLVEGAKSVICVADFYPDKAPAVNADPLTGRIARYAWGDDYHRIIKRPLFALADALAQQWPQHTFRCAVDTAPVMEREHAMNAGLGWIGKHTLVIHPKLGSWMLLGEIVTTLEIQPNPSREPATDHCGSCTRCIDACPTGCIAPDGYKMDASRCISYLTIEHRSAIEPQLHEAMGEWIAGCDICQEVCPFNAHDSADAMTYRDEYAMRAPGPVTALLDVLDWDAEARSKTLTRSALKRIKLDMWKRNALIAAKDQPQLSSRIEAIANDETEAPMVRQTASQVLRRP